ncbi:membrane cofactor protein-like [Cyanistes caeruleus]|uniref:membrane cofactor protein-like n=1 Tax=Cyanistes caeruleus TaxID=156563 RepID=UPI000CDB2B89|nr:membrane cofactor protein-like [Cyanistes caeruleus]
MGVRTLLNASSSCSTPRCVSLLVAKVLFCFFLPLPGSCPRPERLQYAELSQSSMEMQDFPAGSQISFICRPGYIRVTGMSLTWTCGDDLQWSREGVFCTERKCPYPGDLENGYFDPTDLTFGSKLTFFCKEGYRLQGSEEISCDIKGEGVGWSAALPSCEKIPCEPPPKIANGVYEERVSYVYQSSVTYRCQDVPKGSDPFSLIGNATIHCTSDEHSNGVWSGPPPECRVVKCEDPRVENGRKKSGFGNSYSYKDSVVFECEQGYFLVGAEVITCEESSTWVPPIPACEKILVAAPAEVCPAPEVPNGLLVPVKADYNKGESVQIRCNPGCSFPDGSAEVTVTCGEQRSWGALQHCACEPKGSGSTPVINYGRVAAGEKSSYSVGDFITIECYTGYTLQGEPRIQYTGDNQWVPAVPSCQLSGYIIAIICGKYFLKP